MFNKHTFKVIMAFLFVVIFGMVSLVIIDSYKEKPPAESTQTASTTSDLPEVKTTPK